VDQIVSETISRLTRNMYNGEIKDGYAQSYINALDCWRRSPLPANEVATQLLYVSCNLQTWKGQEARETKLMIKQAIALLQKA